MYSSVGKCFIIFSCVFYTSLYIFPTIAILAGELKHGPLGLVDGGTPILTVVSKDATYQVSLGGLIIY